MNTARSPEPVLEIEDLQVHYRLRRGLLQPRRALRAVDGINLALQPGRTLGLVGESGCGKSTLIRTVLGLQKPTSGRILVQGWDINRLSPRALRAVRPRMQLVFQDPNSALNPRMTVHDIIAEPLRLQKRYSRARVEALLAQVGMPSGAGAQRPAAFSGGQRQRIGIARALALEPALLVLDEPVSALDVSIQAQVINLLDDLQQRLGLAYLFVAHDLSVVRHVSHDVAVMYLGRIVETGPRDAVFDRPAHPYTRSLMLAVPQPDLDARLEHAAAASRELPEPAPAATGCVFQPRCPRAQPRCVIEKPLLTPQDDSGHLAACWFPDC